MVILASDSSGRIFHLYDGEARDLGEVRRPTAEYLFGRGGETVYLARGPVWQGNGEEGKGEKGEGISKR